MKYLSLSIGGTPIEAPAGVPTGGMDTGQKIINLGFSLLFVTGVIITIALIIYSGYQLIASQGKPEALQAARDQLVAAIIGLIFIIFSLVILQIIGVDILKIPGLGK